MKRVLALVLLLLMVSGAFAKPVDKSIAMRAAERLMQKPVLDITPQSFTECYLFAGVDGKGFVLLAADDCVRPLLGYSLTGLFPAEDMPAHVRDWLEGVQRSIASAKKSGAGRDPRWDQPLCTSRKDGGRSVSPLITSTWDQVPPYNDLCPYDSVAGGKSMVGCVATATAQVMRFWGHPAVGRGSHSYDTPYGALSADFGTTTYDWNHMPNALTSVSSQEQIDAVSQLCYHVGVAVDMDYSYYGSSAFTQTLGNMVGESSETALKTYFRYNPMLYTDFKGLHSDAEWDSLCMRQLDMGRPIIYSGYGPMGGHAFVVDGYDTLGLFHVNWGWSGNFDGYFTLDSLDIGGGYDFSAYSMALMDVYPIVIDSPRSYIFGVSENNAQGTVQGGGIYQTDSMRIILMADAAPGYRFSHWTSGNPNNPIITSPTRDFADTACFVPLNTDTLSLCSNVEVDYDNYDTCMAAEWGVRFPASYFGFRREVEEVLFVAFEPGLYHLKLYRGETPGSLVYSSDEVVTSCGWQTHVLDAPLPLYDTVPLWITIATDTIMLPIAKTIYSGQPDASWIKLGGTWSLLHEAMQVYVSWPIRAVLAPMNMVHLSVMPNDINKGDIIGGGNYYPGDVAELIAEPHTGYRFFEWSTGSADNPYRFVIDCDTLIIGYFVGRNGIGEIENSGLRIENHGLSLMVENPSGEPVEIYDLQGRQLATSKSSVFNYQFSIPGVYLLRSGATAHKIVAIAK